MSRFVRAGSGSGSGSVENTDVQNEAWVKAQQQVEALKKPKLQDGVQDGGVSLYEKLQQNKGLQGSVNLKYHFSNCILYL